MNITNGKTAREFIKSWEDGSASARRRAYSFKMARAGQVQNMSIASNAKDAEGYLGHKEAADVLGEAERLHVCIALSARVGTYHDPSMKVSTEDLWKQLDCIT